MLNRISVLVTFYNQEKYVDRVIKSIIDQKMNFGMKILVGDDGSTDNTQEIVRKWMKKYPDKIEMHIMNRSPEKHISGFRASSNRLNLLRYVDTEYFIFLDGDDYFDYELKLQKQVDILDDYKNKDCVACGHDIDMLYPDGKRVSMSSKKWREGKYSAKKYWKDMYFHTDTLLIRSCVIPKIDKKILENNFNDNMITFSVIQQGSVYYIPKSWGVYVQTGDGIWTSEKKVVNQIRNMYMYDLCNIINPRFKMQTSHRFSNVWLDVFMLRHHINSKELKEYSIEARDKGMIYSYRWIHYQDLDNVKKILLLTKTLMECWKVILKKCLKAVFKLITRIGEK